MGYNKRHVYGFLRFQDEIPVAGCTVVDLVRATGTSMLYDRGQSRRAYLCNGTYRHSKCFVGGYALPITLELEHSTRAIRLTSAAEQ